MLEFPTIENELAHKMFPWATNEPHEILPQAADASMFPYQKSLVFSSICSFEDGHLLSAFNASTANVNNNIIL